MDEPNSLVHREACARACGWYSRDADEGRVAAVEEGAVDHLQDEGEVLQRQERGGGTNREQHTLQRRQEEREHRGPQVRLTFTLPCEEARAHIS